MEITNIVIGRHKNGHGWYGMGNDYATAVERASKHALRKSVAKLQHRHITFTEPVTNVQVDAFGGIVWEWVNDTGEAKVEHINA